MSVFSGKKKNKSVSFGCAPHSLTWSLPANDFWRLFVSASFFLRLSFRKHRLFNLSNMSFDGFSDHKKMQRASVGSIEDEQAPSILMSTLSISDSSSLMDAASVDVSAKDADQSNDQFVDDDLVSAGDIAEDELKTWNEHAILVSMLRAYFEAKKPGVSKSISFVSISNLFSLAYRR